MLVAQAGPEPVADRAQLGDDLAAGRGQRLGLTVELVEPVKEAVALDRELRPLGRVQAGGLTHGEAPGPMSETPRPLGHRMPS